MAVSGADRQRRYRERRREQRRLQLPLAGAVEPMRDPGELLRWIPANLYVTQGHNVGEPFELLPWEAQFIGEAFGTDYKAAALTVARANGKSTLIGAICAAAVAGPLAQARGDVVCAAASFGQARIVFEAAAAFLRPTIAADSARWRVADSVQTASITNTENGARVRCIGANPKSAHGLQPVLLIADEPAQWPARDSRAMFSVLRTALGKIPGGRFLALGTKPPALSGDWFAGMLGESTAGVYRQIHTADPDGDPRDPAQWRKANPSMDFLPTLREAIEAEAMALDDPEMLRAFRAFRLNLGATGEAEQVLIGADTWLSTVETLDPPAPEGPYCLGVDLSGGAAMAAAAGYWPDSGLLRTVGMFPAVPDLAARGKADGVGDQYELMAAQGDLLIAPGRVVEASELLAQVLARWGRPEAITADRWRERELREALDRVAFPPAALILRGAGYKDGGEDVRDFRRACVGGRVRTAPTLLVRAAIENARTVSDPAGNTKLAKATEGGRYYRARDDVAAAGIGAVAVGLRAAQAAEVAGGYAVRLRIAG